MSFPDRFELLDLMQEGDVQTFRARERGTDRAVVVHFASSPEKLSSLSPVVDHGAHEGKFYVVTAASLDSAGAWRIKPSTAQPAEPPPSASSSASVEPGEFTRMFQLHQAPEPVAMPVPKPADRSPVAASEPGQFTRAFQRPVSAPSSGLASPPAAGPGEFTRMFQTPAAPSVDPAVSQPIPEPVPAVPEPAAQPVDSGSPAAARGPGGLIVAIIALLLAIAVFVLWRKLY